MTDRAEITTELFIRCPDCDGSGAIVYGDEEEDNCGRCGARGFALVLVDSPERIASLTATVEKLTAAITIAINNGAHCAPCCEEAIGALAEVLTEVG